MTPGMVVQAAAAAADDDVVYYVMEPFDRIDPNWIIGTSHKGVGSLNVSIVKGGDNDNAHDVTEEEQQEQEKALFGTGALKVDYEVVQASTWGGVYVIASVLPRLPYRRVHNCYGATHVSVWYKVLEPATIPQRGTFRLLLFESSHCGYDGCPGELETYYSIHHGVLDDDTTINTEKTSWNELRIPLAGAGDDVDAPFRLTGWSGGLGDNAFDPRQIQGYRLEFFINGQGDINSTISGSILLDQLSCVGGSDLFSSPAFHHTPSQEIIVVNDDNDEGTTTTTDNDGNKFVEIIPQNETYDHALDFGVWWERHNTSNDDDDDTRGTQSYADVNLQDGVFYLNYNLTFPTIAAIGNIYDDSNVLLEFQALVPERAYFNLSLATHISMRYQVLETTTTTTTSEEEFNTTTTMMRPYLILALHDSTECNQNCHVYQNGTTAATNNVTRFYSPPQYIFDQTSVPQGILNLSLAQNEWKNIFFDETASGHDDAVGFSDLINLSQIKGFSIAIGVTSSIVDEESDSTMASRAQTISGSVAFSNVRAIATTSSIDDTAVGVSVAEDHSTCAGQSGLALVVKTIWEGSGSYLTVYRRVDEIQSRDCCSLCEMDPKCYYNWNVNNFCYLATALDERMLKLSDAPGNILYVSQSKRGDFCDICDCRWEDLHIDCQGKNLTTVPKYFPSGQSWKPRSLDLRNNPHLLLIPSGSLDEIAGDLEYLRLPRNLRYLAPDSIQSLHSSINVEWEAPEDGDVHTPQLMNAIVEPNGFYDDVCCEPGEEGHPFLGLKFCSLASPSIGSDSVYDGEYLEAIGSKWLEVVWTRSEFLGEVADSLEKCAEYCTIFEGCKFFNHNGQYNRPEKFCRLLSDNGTSTFFEPTAYADENHTRPAWVLGRSPRGRNAVDNARVSISKQHLVAHDGNNYTVKLEVSLLKTPLYGAVWVTPQLATEDVKQFGVTVSPERVALYDESMAATITIEFSKPRATSTGTTLVLTNLIESCDRAYTSMVGETASLTTARIDIAPVENMNLLHPTLYILGITLVVLQIVTSVFFFCWTFYYRGNDIIKRSQPEFLMLTVFGCLLMSLSIVPTLQFGVYRYETNPSTGEMFNSINDRIESLDAACMAFPWIFNVGFTITFSALFAKIWRVRKLLDNARSMRRVTVRPEHMAPVILFFLSIQLAILLSWQLIDPWVWHRKVLETNDSGYSLESVGFCSSEKPLAFILPILVYNFLCLIYALVLCYQTRNITSDLNEAKWITISIISILQILFVAVPLLVIAWEDTNTFFFLRAAVITVMSMSVTCFIMIPKFVHVHFKKEEDESSFISRFQLSRTSRSFTTSLKPSAMGSSQNRPVEMTAAANVAIDPPKSTTDSSKIKGLRSRSLSFDLPEEPEPALEFPDTKAAVAQKDDSEEIIHA